MTANAMDRLAAARPADVVIGDAERDAMLSSIVMSTVALPRSSRRRAWRATAVATAMATAAAAAVVMSAEVAHRSPAVPPSVGARPDQTTLESVRLAVSRSSDFVLHVRTDFRNGVLWDAWFDDVTRRARTRSSSLTGTPVYDHQMSCADGGCSVRVVSYVDRAWWDYNVPEDLAATSDVPTPDEIRAQVNDGSLREVGREGALLHLRADAASSAERKDSGFDLWVSSDSYLPMRIETPGFEGQAVVSTLDWLSRSPENLEALVAPVPDGFAQLREPPDTAPQRLGK